MIFANLIQITDSTLQYMKFGKKVTEKRTGACTACNFCCADAAIKANAEGLSVSKCDRARQEKAASPG
jgi:hypothetical protein